MNTIELYSRVLPALNKQSAPLASVQYAMQETTTQLGITAWRMVCQEQEVCSAQAQLITLAQSTSILSFPLLVHNRQVGTLECLCSHLAAEARIALTTIADLCALVFMLHYQATHDVDTGLYNRAFLNDYLEKRGETGDAVVVAEIDVDGLKTANDTRGHEYGDGLLRAVAHELKQCCRIKDFALRAGGDEFLLILREVPHRRVEWLKRALNVRLETVVQSLKSTSFSFGIVGGDAADLRQLITQADRQMYVHKKQNHQALYRRPLIMSRDHYEQIELF